MLTISMQSISGARKSSNKSARLLVVGLHSRYSELTDVDMPLNAQGTVIDV